MEEGEAKEGRVGRHLYVMLQPSIAPGQKQVRLLQFADRERQPDASSEIQGCQPLHALRVSTR